MTKIDKFLFVRVVPLMFFGSAKAFQKLRADRFYPPQKVKIVLYLIIYLNFISKITKTLPKVVITF